MPITKGFRALVDEAMAQVATYSVDEVRARLHDPKVQIGRASCRERVSIDV